MRFQQRPNSWKNAAAGALGGLVASFAMNQFQSLLKAAEDKIQPPPPQKPPEAGDDATVQTAQAISRGTVGHDLAPSQKKPAGSAVHYAYGTLIGAIYGVLSGLAPVVTAGRGTAYGAAAWLGGDEIGVPAFGLGKAPTQVPPADHAKELAAHLVHGAVTDGIVRLIVKPA